MRRPEVHFQEQSQAARRGRSTRRELLSWILVIVIAVGGALLIRAFLLEFVLVDGPSMNPTLQTGERLIIEKVSRYAGLPDRGDIVIVHYPERTENFIKRTIALPGETVEIRDSVVYIDGVPLEEGYISPEPYADYGPFTVPPDHIFVMGDNRANSMDSRALQVGPIPSDAIVGHGLFVVWPLDQMHWISSG